MGWMGSLIPPNFSLLKSSFFAANLYILYKKLYYNCNIMTITDWLGLTLTSLSILTIIGVALRWVIRHYVQDIAKELKPNGGSSLKDQVNRLEKEMKEADQVRKEMNKKIDHMYEVLLDYISKNQNSSRTKKPKI